MVAAGLILDAGALIAIERGRSSTRSLIHIAVEDKAPVVVPSVVLAQVWRDPRRQVLLTRLLQGCVVEPVDRSLAEAAGLLCAAAGTTDVVDAVVVASARRRHAAVLTADAPDLARLASADGGRAVRLVEV